MVLAMFVAVWSQRTSASSSTTCPPTSQPSSVPPSMPPAPLTSSPPSPRRRPPASSLRRLRRPSPTPPPHPPRHPGCRPRRHGRLPQGAQAHQQGGRRGPHRRKGPLQEAARPHLAHARQEDKAARRRPQDTTQAYFMYDAVTYLKCLDTLRVLEGVRSVWILADSSHKIFELAKRRVYRIVRADCTKVSTDNKDTPAKKRKVTHISTKKGKETENEDSTADKGGIRKINADVGIVLEEVLEEAPKWKVLRELLQEIAQEQTKGDGENAQDEDKSDESGIVSVTCKYERSCLQLQECISKGFHQV